MTAYTLPALTSDSGLSQYLRDINRFPYLSEEEEYMLGKRLQEHGDVEAAHELTTSHLRLVAKIAMSFRGYGLPLVELISEGNIGLMQAVKRFDPEKGFRLATYAMWWIKAAIQEYVLHSWSLVKMGTTAAQKKLFFNLRKIKNRLNRMEQGDLSPEDVALIAHELDVPEHEVVDMNRRLSHSDQSLNDPMGTEEGTGEWIDILPETSDNQEIMVAEVQEKEQKQALLMQAMETLNERERTIILERRMQEKPATLDDLSKQFSISRERVRQIENRAFEKLQHAVINSNNA